MTARLTASATVALLVASALLNGVAGALMAFVVVLAVRRGATPQHLLRAALVCLVFAAAYTVLIGLPDEASVSAAFVIRRLLSHHLTFGALLLLVVGVLLEEHAAAREHEDAR